MAGTGSHPFTQVRLTNVAIVKLKKGKKRFEIACYKNKVVNWREGLETDLSEVLQMDEIFKDVVRGDKAKNKDILAAFGTTDRKKVCMEILTKGAFQVSEKERAVQIETLFKEIACIIVEKCIDHSTQRPFTVSVIEKTMKDKLNFSVNVTKTAKQQALEIIPLLKQHLPLVRCHMKVRFRVGSKHIKLMKAELAKNRVQIIQEEFDSTCNDSMYVCLIDPGAFRAINDLVGQCSKGADQVEVLEMSAQGNISSIGDITSHPDVSMSELSVAMEALHGVDKKPTDDEASETIPPAPSVPVEAFSSENEATIVALVGEEVAMPKDTMTEAAELGLANIVMQDKKKRQDKAAKKAKKKLAKKNKKAAAIASGQVPEKAPAMPTEEAKPPPVILDLCGYTYESARGGWLLRPPADDELFDEDDEVEDLLDNQTAIVRNRLNSWKLFGPNEKPAMWNQKHGGWLVPKKYDSRLDVLGAVRM
jgi:ribosome maturation protein SDO1